METYNKQIQRIKNKLLEAKEADKNLNVFGAESHKYYLNPPVNEAEVLKFEQKFPFEKDYILVNLHHRLAEYGLTNQTVLNIK